MKHQERGDLAEALALVQRDLTTLVQPHVASPAAQSHLAMIGMLLGMIEAELDPQGRETIVDDAIGGAAHLVGCAGEAAALAQAVASGPLERFSAEARAAIAAIASAEEIRLTGRHRAGHDSYGESGAGAKASDGEAAPTFDAATLQRYLTQERACRDIEVTGLRQLPGGFSKSTWLADLTIGGRGEQWVLRRDMAFSPLRSAVHEEYPVLAALYRMGLPIAEPLWCEPDPARLGAATIAVRRVSGSGNVAEWGSDPASAAAIGRECAKLGAHLHALDLSTLPPLITDAPGARGDTPSAQLDHLRAFWEEKRIAPNPLVELVFAWLAANAPPPGRRGLVHGDFGLHNVLVQDGAIVALLDWEFAHAGDPQEDLAYARPFIARIMPWDDFVAAYVAAGGIQPDEASINWYTVFGTFRNALGCFNVLHALRHRLRTIDSKFAYVGRAYANALLLEAARTASLV